MDKKDGNILEKKNILISEEINWINEINQIPSN